MNALIQDTVDEFTLAPGFTSAWITVDNVRVHIRRGSDGVSVSLYPLNREEEED
mgnify:CR=1 FL=1